MLLAQMLKNEIFLDHPGGLGYEDASFFGAAYMARRCSITRKGVQSGNKVSHSNRKTRRRFMPNMQSVSLKSDALNQVVRLKLSVNGLRTLDHNGGLDSFLLTTPTHKLSPEAQTLKRRIKKALKNKKAA